MKPNNDSNEAGPQRRAKRRRMTRVVIQEYFRIGSCKINPAAETVASALQGSTFTNS
jgi:hypothetical protein